LKVWVETRTIKPPEFTVSARFGASIMFVGYSKITDQWFWLQPGGILEKIAEPPLVFVEQGYVNKHTLATPRARIEKSSRIRRSKAAKQLVFGL
jgi:hypothetical protein